MFCASLPEPAPEKTTYFPGEALFSQPSKPFLTALQFSGGHGCVSLVLRKTKILISAAEERGFEAQLCKAQAARPIFRWLPLIL